MKIKAINLDMPPNCRYCKAEGHKVAAKWHLTGANTQACDVHKSTLEYLKAQADAESNQEPSLADEQTWMRL